MGTELTKSSLGRLLDEGRTPSGAPFELQPDTVEIALRVSEADDTRLWAKKAKQVLQLTASIGGKDPSKEGGLDFISSLPDVDVVFLALAWNCEMNGRKMELPEGVPCPQCAHPLTSIDMSVLEIMAWPERPDLTPTAPVQGMDPKLLPESLRDGELLVTLPTWYDARRSVPEGSWDNIDVILMRRAMAAIRLKGTNGVRAAVIAEQTKLKARSIRVIIKAMSDAIPSIARTLPLTCPKCQNRAEIPFDQGV